MNEADHSRVNELFTDYQEKTISTEDKAFFDTHLEQCANCRGDWEKYQKVVSALSGLKQKDPPPEATPDILQGTTDKINRRTRGLFFRRNRLGISYELIAILVLLLFGSIYLVLHLMRSTETGKPMQQTPPPKQGALPKPKPSTPTKSDEPRPQGVVVEQYTLALNAPANELNQRHVERILLTASGTLSPWQEATEGVSAEFTVPYNKFVGFYKDLGASFTWTETKETTRVPQLNPPVTGTLILQKE